MATGSQNMTTYIAKQVIGDITNADWSGALLHSGKDGKSNSIDTWIFADDYGSASSNYGIRHNQAEDTIEFVGASIARTTIHLGKSEIVASHLVGGADTWYTARTLTIGNTGKSVNGSANVSWSKDEILGASTDAYFLRGDKTWSNSLSANFSAGTYILAGTYLQAKNHMYLDAGHFYMKYNNTWYSVLHNHNNGNISVEAASGGLYIGYSNTTLINWLNGKMSLDSNGNLTMKNDIYYQGTKANFRMIRFIDNTSDGNGNGISIGGGGLTLIGSGESADTLISSLNLTTSGGTETLYVASDNSIEFYPGQQSYSAAARIWMTAGVLNIGVDGNTTRENSLNIYSGAGRVQLYSGAATNGNRGLWFGAHGTGGAKSVITVNTNNNVNVTANEMYTDTIVTYSSAGFISSAAGSPWPYIRFDTRAGGSTYVTTAQTSWCELYAQVPAKRNSTYYKTRFFFRQYSKTANTTTRLSYYEDYYLPETNDGRTGNASYNILTTKDMSFSITGNAATATTATTATALYTGGPSNTSSSGQDARIKDAIKAYFDANKASIPRNKTISLYVSTGNGEQATGYFLSGYDSAPYGGFFVCHYDTPRYVGISNGSYSCYELVRNDSRTYSINVSGSSSSCTGNSATTSKLLDSAHSWTATEVYNYMTDRVLKAGDTMSGNLFITTASGDHYFEVKSNATGVRLELDNSGSTNHGVWSSGYWNGSAYTASSLWMIYRNASGTVVVNGNCTGSAGSVAWDNVSSKPATATRWPSWSEVTSKPAVQNNLTSTSTTDMLSAAQGRALNENKTAKGTGLAYTTLLNQTYAGTSYKSITVSNISSYNALHFACYFKSFWRGSMLIPINDFKSNQVTIFFMINGSTPEYANFKYISDTSIQISTDYGNSLVFRIWGAKTS